MFPRAAWLLILAGCVAAVGTLPGRAQPPGPLPPGVRPPGASPLPAPAELPLDLVEFRALPLQEAMRLLSQQSGLKIVPSAEAGKTNVSLYLQNVPPMTAVAAVAQANGLVYRRDAETGIVRIFTPKENQRDLASFREDQTKVFTLLYPNAVNVAQAIRDLFGDRVQLNLNQNNDFQQYQELQNRFTRFDLINSRSLGLGFPQQGGFGGGFGGGLGGGFGGGFGGGLGGGFGGGLGGFGGRFGGVGGFGGGIGGFSGGVNPVVNPTPPRNTDPNAPENRTDTRLLGLTPEEIQELENTFGPGNIPTDRAAILEFLRRKPGNIYVTVIRQHNQLVVRTSDMNVLMQVCDLVAQLDVPTPVVLLEVKVLSLLLTDDFRSVFDFQFTDGVLTAGGFTTGNILPPSADALTPATRRFADITPASLAPPPYGSNRDLVFQVVSANFRARLQLLEDKNRVTELATPLLMTANNEVSRIFVGQSQPITVGFNPSTVLSNGVAANTTFSGTPQTVLQDVGTTLLVTPNINMDRTVTLRLLQENSNVVPQGANIPVLNTNGTVTQVPVDIVRRQNLSGTVVAKDGLTIAVGGLIDETVTDQRSQVPVLGNIPGVGFFFRRQFQERARRELVVLIRPFVLTTPCESAAVSRSLIEALSIHPNVVAADLSTMRSFTPAEVARPCPPQTRAQQIFQLHSVCPKTY